MSKQEEKGTSQEYQCTNCAEYFEVLFEHDEPPEFFECNYCGFEAVKTSTESGL